MRAVGHRERAPVSDRLLCATAARTPPHAVRRQEAGPDGALSPPPKLAHKQMYIATTVRGSSWFVG